MVIAILFCKLLAISSCNKDPETTPDQTKKIVLSNVIIYGDNLICDSIIETYSYNTEFNITKVLTQNLATGDTIEENQYSYIDNQIIVNNKSYHSIISSKYICSTDKKGRITHIFKENENGTITTFDYTYDTTGHIESSIIDSSIYTIYTWEDNNIIQESSLYAYSYEISNIKNQFYPINFIEYYGIPLKELSGQGCYGQIPTHLPAQMTISRFGQTDIVYKYKYIINSEGYLSSCKAKISENTSDIKTTNYIFSWKKL